jgi:penicillin-binding protein 1A
VRQIVPSEWKKKLRHFMLDLDARIDSTLFSSGKGARELYERFSTFMDRFYVGRWKRWVFIEPLSEAATIGLGGLILMLALAVPAFRETADDDWLKKSDLAVTFLDRYGNPIGSRGIKHNDSIPLEDFPDNLIKATLATEDRRFYDHFGIDIAGTARALVTNAQAGGVRQGGSSITQQLAKNLFLNNERTIERKVKEAFLAVWLETRLTKNEILKLYLDRAYMGGGTFGVDGAAHFYFNKSARDVNLAESAMLAGLFKAPTKYAPHINLPAARARANVVLDNLVDAGFMTEGQVFGARRNPANAVDRRDENSPNYYLDWAFDEMRKLVDTFPKSYVERVFVVRTAIDMNVQHAAEETIENQLRQFGRDYHATQAATVVADLDGGVRAMVGGRDYGASQFNRAVDAMRQPGSSFKPYVYATALLNGFKPTSIVVDGPVCIGNWCPQNYGHSYSGSVTLTQAITRSINVVPVKLSIALGGKVQNPAKAGRAKVVEVARRFGIKAPLLDTPSLPIGSAEVSVVEHAVAYATFPNRGKSVTPHAVLEVRTGAGDLVWRFDRDGKKPLQAIPASVASDMAGMMSHVVSEGTARRAARCHLAPPPARRHSDRGQDRHHQCLSRCLVRRLHRQLHLRGVVRQRRLLADQPHDRRLAAGADLARHHGRRASGRRGEGNPGHRNGHQAAAGAGPGRRQCRAKNSRNKTGTAADPHQARRRHSGARGEITRRRSEDRGQNIVERSGQAGKAAVIDFRRVPGQLCGGCVPGSTLAAQELTVRLLLFTLLALIIATAVGLGATWMTATRGTDLGTLTIGAWTARPRTGTAEVDPYSRASIARSGELPVGTGDGVAFSATTDDRKKPLDGRCDVLVSGVTPAARFWTLTLYDSKGHLVANSLQRYGFTSQEIIRASDGAFEVRVASRSRSGNWLPTGGIERYALMLRLYDTPVGVATRTQRDAPMPSIATVGCP